MKWVKSLQVLKLKGKNLVKSAEAREMAYQIELNEGNAIQLLKELQGGLLRKEAEVAYLKSMISTQSQREMAIIQEKDEMGHSIAMSCKLMAEMRLEAAILKDEQGCLYHKYEKMVVLYNEAMGLVEKKEREYEWLNETMKAREHADHSFSKISRLSPIARYK